MFLTSLKIRNFRNIVKIDIEFKDLINYFYSPNGTGKTNLLEAIQCLSIGKTLRAKSEAELLNYTDDSTNKSVILQGSFSDNEGIDFTQTYSLETQKSDNLSNDSDKLNRSKKTLLVNKTKTNINNYVGRVPSIWFSPESIKIINSSPKNKREYFDQILIQLFPEYLYNLRNYNKALKHRNRLLQEGGFKANMIRVWTEELIIYGSKIIKARHDFFIMLNKYFIDLDEVTRYKFKIEYKPNITLNSIFEEDPIYKFREELRNSYEKDKRKMSTTVGPHRDDWFMLIQISNGFIRADKFASRGQQRMSLIILQLVLIKLFESRLDKKPILLLDDIFSELDEENEKILLDVIHHNNIQSFITGVEEKEFDNIREINLYNLL